MSEIHQFTQKDADALKELVYLKIKALDEKMTAVVQSNREAVIKAEQKMDIRLEGMNQFRDQLKEQAGTFLTIAEYKIFCEKIDESIESLKLSRAELNGKASQLNLNITMLISIIGLLMAIVNFFSK